MNSLLLCLALLSPVQDVEADAPSEEHVEQAVEELSRAFGKEGGLGLKVQAISAASEVTHPAVIKWIVKGLKDSDDEVRGASIEALRFMEHPDANDALVTTLMRDKRLRKNAELYEALIKAVCQHADPKSLSLIANYDLKDETKGTLRARVYGIARFRTAESVEALFDVMRRGKKGRLHASMSDISTALRVLTGVDHGKSAAAWTKWWNENKRDLKVSPELPELPKKILTTWSRYWGLEEPKEGRARQGERGEQPDSEGKRK